MTNKNPPGMAMMMMRRSKDFSATHAQSVLILYKTKKTSPATAYSACIFWSLFGVYLEFWVGHLLGVSSFVAEHGLGSFKSFCFRVDIHD